MSYNFNTCQSGGGFAAFAFYVYVSTAVILILQIVCCRFRLEREHLNCGFRNVYREWSEMIWIYITYNRMLKDIENFNYFFSKIFGFLFIASSFYTVFQVSVSYLTGMDKVITLIVTNTALPLVFMGIVYPNLFSGFVNMWVSKVYI